MATIDEVFEAIRNERKYQDELFGDTELEGLHSITEMLVYIKDYTEEALHIESRLVNPEADEKALHIIRKIAALAVSTMEQHGIMHRDMKDLAKCCELHGICPEEE